MTTATIAFEFKRILTDAARKTGGDEGFVALQGHDFSFRGVEGWEASAKLGQGHLANFIGTDTIPAIARIKKNYITMPENPVGVSVPASEHSVACMNISENTDLFQGEVDMIERFITELFPTGIVSLVSDTYDFWSIVTKALPLLKDKIMARQPNAIGLNKVVIRPDSGDPVDIICGEEFKTLSDTPEGQSFDDWKEWVAESVDEIFCDNLDAEAPHYSESTLWQRGGKYFKVTYEPDLNRHDKKYYFVDNFGSDVSKCTFEEITPTAEQKGAIQCLWDIFGGTTTETGHKLLDEHIGLIYGDSITTDRATEICRRLADKGFASTNVVFGIGSYSYQYNTRDTFGFAMKATYGVVNGEGREIFKDPKTDSGIKKSAKGLLRVDEVDGTFVLTDQVGSLDETLDDAMQDIFIDGKALDNDSWETITGRLASYL